MMKKLIGLLFMGFIFAGCTKAKLVTNTNCTFVASTLVAPASEVNSLKPYVMANSPAAIQDSSGVFYDITTQGTGVTPVLCSYIKVKYTGRLTNGTIFAQDLFGSTLILGNLIVGWQKSLPFLKKGGSIHLYVPPTLGYGSAGSGTVPPNANLDFTIELVDVQ